MALAIWHRVRGLPMAARARPDAMLSAGELSFSTLNKAEVRKFTGLEWDGPEGRALVEMHSARMQCVDDFVAHVEKMKMGKMEKMGASTLGLSGARVLDVGCGGGLLSKSLVERGASVVCLDPVAGNVQRTKEMVAELGGNAVDRIEGRVGTVEEVMEREGRHAFDFVMSLEVIEHVDDQERFLACCSELAKKGLALSTINRTVKSYLLAIVAAEYVTGKVPPGTHDWAKFVQPIEIERVIHLHGLNTDLVTGLVYNPLCNTWHASSFETDVNYMLFASR